MAFVLPLILVWRTHSKYLTKHDNYNLDFWISKLSFFEQPNVKHLSEMLVIYQTTNGVYYASINKDLSDLFGDASLDIAPTFSVRLITL